MSLISRLDSSAADFDARLTSLLDRGVDQGRAVEKTVREILADVVERGDVAVLEHTRRLDRREVEDIAALEIASDQRDAALQDLDGELRGALEFAAERIHAYAERQRESDWDYTDGRGNRLGQRSTPLDRVGVYVPGGRAAYPSSVLMNVIPARVAGVGQIIMVVPAPEGEISPLVLAAAALGGVDRLFTIGGAQAVGALAHGTESIPAVDKIVGPGNAWVAAAKRQVFGRVGIDSIAGPSEIAILGDGSMDPEWTALDLFAQAEHDEMAQALLVSPDGQYLDQVAAAAERLISEMPRAEIIRASLSQRGALIQVRDLEEGASVINRIAPEHLELALDDPEPSLARVRHAGAIFIGHHSPEAFGDYCAGPNHVLPTAGTARFSSPLGVQDFRKRSSLIECRPGAGDELADAAEILARAEGLEAHARSAAVRRKRR